MHTTSYHRIAVLALALGLSATFASAQTSDNTTPPTDTSSSKHFRHHDSVLTPDERAQLKKDFDAVLSSNADLKTELDNLKAQEKALHDQRQELHQKIHAALVAEDPSIEPILAKLKAAHKDGQGGRGGWGHHHGDKPADSTTTTDSSSQ